MQSLEKITNYESAACDFLACTSDSEFGFQPVIFRVFECGRLSLSHADDPQPAMIAVASHLDFAQVGFPDYEVFADQSIEPLDVETGFVSSLLNGDDKLLQT